MAGEKVSDQSASAAASATPSASPHSTHQPSIETNFYFQNKSKKLKKLPPILDHFNARDLKVLFKCCAAVWIYTLFILINPTLRVIGQAAFFGVIVMFIAPPSGVIFIELMAGLTVVLGARLAWAWGSITMKAALATRPAADLRAQLLRIEQSRNTTNIVTASGQSTYEQIAIYNGATLDARVTVTIFCMMGIFIYLVARLRVSYPKLTLVSIFAMVISDIYLTIAPLIPTFQGTLARLLVLPAGIALGVGLVCNIIFFPRSTSHLVLDGMQAVLAPMPAFLEANLLNFQNPTRHMEISRLLQTKARVVGAFKALDANFSFLSLDASMGRFGSDDIKGLHEPLRRVLTMFSGLLQIHIGRLEFRMRDERMREIADLIDPEDAPVKAGRQHMTRLYDYRQRSRHPESQQLLEDSLAALGSAGSDLLQAEQQAMTAIIRSLRSSNSRRWFKRPSKQECESNAAENAAVLANLQQHRAAFSGRTAKDLWAKHKHLFDTNGHLIAYNADDHSPPTAGIIFTLVLEERIADLAEAVEVLLARMVEMGRKRTHVRLWLPGNLQNFLPWALNQDVILGTPDGKAVSISSSEDDSTDNVSNASTSNLKDEGKHKSHKHKKSKSTNPHSAAAQLHQMRLRGVQKRSLGGRTLLGIGHWFSNIEGLYALRILVASIAIGVIAVIPKTAGFFYRNKGLWALIMSQTALLPYTADFVASFLLRLAGTVIGAILGMVVWYTGSGNGPGSPYGIAAILVPFIIVFMWIRLFASPAFLQGVILMTVTTYLVWAYSWDDTHIPSYGNPGIGYNVFWRRMLLVMIGFTVAAIVTFFPRPPSASLHYRRLLGGSLQNIKNDYTLFTLNMSFDAEATPAPDLKVVAEKSALATAQVLLGIQPTIPLTRFEFSSSNFDSKSLSKICDLSLTLNQSATQLLLYATQLPHHLRERFLRITGATEEHFVADINAVLTMIQQSLKTGDPLPAVLPTPLIVRCMEGTKRRIKGNEHVIQFNEELLEREATRVFCTAMSAYTQFLHTIDELVVVVKDRVGETGWDGDAVWGERGIGGRKPNRYEDGHQSDDKGAGAGAGAAVQVDTLGEKQQLQQSQVVSQTEIMPSYMSTTHDAVTSEKGAGDLSTRSTTTRTTSGNANANDSSVGNQFGSGTNQYQAVTVPSNDATGTASTMQQSRSQSQSQLQSQSQSPSQSPAQAQAQAQSQSQSQWQSTATQALSSHPITTTRTSESNQGGAGYTTTMRTSSETGEFRSGTVPQNINIESQDWGLDEIQRRSSREEDWNWNRYSVCAGCGSPTCFVLHRSSVNTYF